MINLWSLLCRAVQLYPDKIALREGEFQLTYRELGQQSAALAQFLAAQGVRAGDRIAILDLNSHAFFEAYYAAAAAGAILVPLNVRLAAVEIQGILRDAGARFLVAHPCFAGLVEEALDQATPLEGILWTAGGSMSPGIPGHTWEEALATRTAAWEPVAVDPTEVAQLYYTSGTTGDPKGVMLSHRNVCLHAQGAVTELGLTDEDVWGHIAPMFHLADAWATFAVTWVGGTHVMVPSFEAQLVLETIEQEHITLSNLIPTMLNLMVKHPSLSAYDLSSLRVILSGGAPIAPELVCTIMETFGCDYIQTYGMTETSPYLTLSVLKEHLRALPLEQQLIYKAKTGRPFCTVELKVVDEHDQPVRTDGRQVGEILVRGDTVTRGYWQRSEETRAAFSNGWLRTGDLAVLDDEGYVDIVDRKKDMIISGGENVFSIEVENVLSTHPAVLEAAVVGMPDEKWGEVVKGVVALKSGQEASESELIQHCRERLAGFKAPRSIVFLPQLPKTGSGKIYKKGLR
jgi:acyl-CoA synthetase (AMP-forming)/AMP-acid ligase II